jgi:heme A synthase
MLYLKQRIFAVIIILVFAVILYLTWNDARYNGGYYLKMAIFAPVGIVSGGFLLFFPQFSGKPETSRAKIITLTVLGIGILLGLYNWYLIDPRGFPF